MTNRVKYDRRMLEALVCPLTQDVLEYNEENQELISKSAGLAYPIRDGIPIMLADEARCFGPGTESQPPCTCTRAHHVGGGPISAWSHLAGVLSCPLLVTTCMRARRGALILIPLAPPPIHLPHTCMQPPSSYPAHVRRLTTT